jgi:hypothetical protein
MKARLSLAAAAILLCCGTPKPPAAPPAPPPPPVDDNLLALAPAAYSQVARVDVALLRASPLWGLSELAMTDPTFAALLSAGGEDPLLAIDEILITGGNPSGDGADEILVVAKGRIDAEPLAAAIAAKLPAAGPGSAVARPELEAVALTKRTIAIGTPAIVEEAAALAARKGRSLVDDAAFADLALAEGTAAVYRFRRGAEELALVRLRAAPFKDFDWSRRATSASGFLKIGAGVSAEIAFALDDPKIAARARRDLKRTLRRFAGNAIVRLIGVGQLLGLIAVAGENERVELRVALAEADVVQLRTLVERIAQIRELMADDGAEDDDPIELEPPMLEHADRAQGAEGKAE